MSLADNLTKNLLKKLFVIIIPFILHGLDYSDFDKYQYTLTKDTVEQRIQAYLEKESSIQKYYLITQNALYLFPNEQAKQAHQPEFTLHFAQKDNPIKRDYPQTQNPDLPLEGWKIAIDPGHFGGNFAHLEERYIDMKPSQQIGYREDIQFNEGELAYLTALELQSRLEKLGASVFVTKDKLDKQFLSFDFETFYQNEYQSAVDTLVSYYPEKDKDKMLKHWKKNASLSDFFRMTYNFMEIEERAKQINAFEPHLTVFIHYNLGGIYDASGKNPGTADNYSMLFIPGAFKDLKPYSEGFGKKSLYQAENRYEFIRMLVTSDIDDSIEVSTLCLQAFQKNLKLPLPKKLKYLDLLCIENKPGIYHRNLMLLRLVHGATLYGEPLCQDNFEEALNLSEKNAQIKEYRAPKRLLEVAGAYETAIIKWAKEKGKLSEAS